MRRLLALLFCLSGLFTTGWAQNLQAYVTRKILAPGEALELVVATTLPDPAETPAFPEIAGFRKGPQRRVQAGGETRFIQAYQPQRQGIFEVPTHTFRLGRQAYIMVGFPVRVGEVSSPPPAEAPLPGRSRPTTLPTGRPQLRLSLPEGPLLARLPVRLDLWLDLPAGPAYRPGPELLAAAAAQLGTLTWAQETVALAAPRLQAHEGTHHWLLYRSYLIPPDSGELRLGPVTLDLPGGTPVVATAQRLRVQPLPPTALPQAQNPGRFRLEALLPKSRYVTGEAIPLQLVVSGSGALRGLPLPQLRLPAGLAQGDPELSLTLQKGDSLLGGRKVYRIDLLAAYPGTYTLPPARLYVYDPVRAAYDSLLSAPLRLEVRGDSLPQLLGGGGFDRFYQEALAQASTQPPSGRDWPGWLPWACLALLLAAGAWRWWR